MCQWVERCSIEGDDEKSRSWEANKCDYWVLEDSRDNGIVKRHLEYGKQESKMALSFAIFEVSRSHKISRTVIYRLDTLALNILTSRVGGGGSG